MALTFVTLSVTVALGSAASALAGSGGGECWDVATHHSHLTLPLAHSRTACKQPAAKFFLSHGATFFCPHTFDVKLLATIHEDAARATLCDSHFDALGQAEKGVSPKHVLRPTLPAGGLPALARGELSSWTSPVMYHVHSFGRDNAAGPDAGWNVTTIRNQTTTIKVVRVLYSRELDVQPRPGALTYLVHANPYEPQKHLANAILSHFITSSGPSGFDQVFTASLTSAGKQDEPIRLRKTWPLFLTLPGRDDAFDKRLTAAEPSAAAVLHVYDEKTGLPKELACSVRLELDYYAGTSDGFAGYGTMCFDAPGSKGTRSGTTCIPRA